MFGNIGSEGKLSLVQVGVVFLVAFMLTGLSGFLLNTTDTTRAVTNYENISDLEPLVRWTDIDDWEVYNPIGNVTGFQAKMRDVEGITNVWIPTTDTPNKYVKSPTVIGYEKSKTPHTMWYNSPSEDAHGIFRYSITNDPYLEVVTHIITGPENYAYRMWKYGM